MELHKLRRNFKRLSHPETIADCNEVIDIYCDFILQTIHKRRNESVRDMEAHAGIILQMIMTKLLHLKSAIAGVTFKSASGIQLNNIVDFTVIGSLTRNIYETVGMFCLIFRVNSTGDERTIVYNLWTNSGLKYRQRFENSITTNENRAQLKLEQDAIDKCINEIRNTDLFKNLDEKSRLKIENQLKTKEYLAYFKTKKVFISSWREIYHVIGARKDFFEHLYTFFSLYSHPSYVSVFQFRDMYQPESEEFKGMTMFNLQNVFMLTGIFIADFIYLFPKTIDIFNSMPILHQAIINFQNIFSRSEKYSINDSLKALG